MTNELAVTEIGYSREKIELIKRTIAVGATDDELQLFMHIVKRTGLDPFARQIYAIKRKDNQSATERMVVQTGIDGYRLIADRTGKLAGISDPIYQENEGAKVPAAATVTVKKLLDGGILAEFTATARWFEYVATGKGAFMWTTKPYLMLGKCAEALALRKAFPADLSGVYTAEEMAQADNPAAEAVFAEVERQKGTQVFTQNTPPDHPQYAPQAILPPELDWQYQRNSGVLICRIVEAQKRIAKDKREFVALVINNKLDETHPNKPMLFYWHNTHRDLLLGGKDKVIKVVISQRIDKKGPIFTIEQLLEFDGKVLDTPKEVPPVAGIKPIGDPETQARLLASVLDMDEVHLDELLRLTHDNWQGALEFLQREQARREVTA